jgi:hypothetical protein
MMTIRIVPSIGDLLIKEFIDLFATNAPNMPAEKKSATA